MVFLIKYYDVPVSISTFGQCLGLYVLDKV